MRADFLSRMAAQPEVMVEPLDFQGAPDANCTRMNEWTREQAGEAELSAMAHDASAHANAQSMVKPEITWSRRAI